MGYIHIYFEKNKLVILVFHNVSSIFAPTRNVLREHMQAIGPAHAKLLGLVFFCFIFFLLVKSVGVGNL